MDLHDIIVVNGRLVLFYDNLFISTYSYYSHVSLNLCFKIDFLKN